MAQTAGARAGEAEMHAAGSSGPGRVRLAVPVLLAAGWGALFSFMAVVLMDDDLVSPEPDATPLPIGAQAASFEMPPPVDRGRPVWPEPRRMAALPGSGVPDARLGDRTEEAPQAAEPAPASPPVFERADYVGTWGPTVSACGAPSRRKGYLPAVLTQGGARAGRTLCRFRNGRREGPGWAVAAECSERGRRWTSQVRLVVDGDRLTWTSAKGAASYVRCGRRDG